MKKSAVLGLSILGAAALVACGGNGNGDGESGVPGDGGGGGIASGSSAAKSRTTSTGASSTSATSTSATTGSGAGGSGSSPAIVNAVFPPMTNDTDFMTTVVASPWVDGINPHLAWSAVDKGPNAPKQYQWSDYDASIQPFFDAAQTHGKKVNIIVYAIGYTTAELAPDYVMENTALHKVNCSQQSDWPVVYEAPFKNAYKAFITEVIAHYANNPLIGYIRFGLSRGGEIYPFCADQEMALVGETNLNTWLSDYWAKYDKEMLDYEKAQHPTMKIMAPATESGSPDVTISEAASAIHDGFGFGCQGLEKTDLANAPSDCNGDWCALFGQYKGLAQLELQTIGQSDAAGTLDASSCGSDDSACKNQAATGPLPPLVDLGLEYHATIFEIYADDLLLALDSNSHLNGGKGYCNNLGQCYSEYGAAYTAALKKAHGH